MTAEPLGITGTRVVLRDLHLADLPAVEHWMQPGHAWQRLDGPYYARPSLEELPGILARLRERVAAPDKEQPRGRLVIAERETDRFLGTVSRYWLSEETDWLAIGITLHDPQLWGHGLGYEALGLWCQHLFDVMPQLVRLDIRTWSGNVGMMRLAEKLGFREEARFRNARRVDGVLHDGMGYGVLREEWSARYPGGFGQSNHHAIT